MANHNHDNSTSLGLEIVVPFTWNAVNILVTLPVFGPASRRYKVVAIAGAPIIAGLGGACTFVLRKAPSGTALGSGTLLHSGSFDVVGTADTNQTLTLSATASDLEIAVGDRIGLVLTGVPTGAAGVGTITMVPN